MLTLTVCYLDHQPIDETIAEDGLLMQHASRIDANRQQVCQKSIHQQFLLLTTARTRRIKTQGANLLTLAGKRAHKLT